jgi:hypothetical protein
MSAATATPLLFNWGPPRRRNLALIGFLAASFAAHAGSFYLFQIVYPPTVSLAPAPQRVNLITANSEQGATLLRWVDAEDPALASTTRRPSDAKRYLLGKIEHVPSYFEREPALKEAPPPTVDLRIPSAQAPGPVPVFNRASTQPIGTSGTTLTFSNELNKLGQPKTAQVKFQASTREPPQNAQFRIAVDALGAVVYCFNVASSGDAALDEQARSYLALCRFPARAVPSGAEGQSRSTSNDHSLVWGIATIEWGNDVVAANAKPTPSAP